MKNPNSIVISGIGFSTYIRCMGAKIKNNAPMRRLFIGRSFTAHKYKVTITNGPLENQAAFLP